MLQQSNGMTFHKSNHSSHPEALCQEAAGLEAIRQVLTEHQIPIQIPQVHAVNDHSLKLQRIDHRAGSAHQWTAFGQALAQLHQIPQAQLGWLQDNFIGLNPQRNGWSDDWGQFFCQHRLGFQLTLLRDVQQRRTWQQLLDRIKRPLTQWLNQHLDHPSLLHGDLWSGNVLFDATGVWLIDPAVYCGDAEADLAMTQLFGGFPAVFYRGYESARPLSAAYPVKKIIYNLYHQLNHLNLFGSGYLGGCERAFAVLLQRFG
ncbi:fructosamine kinase family protein [Marinicella meishanensis]|uniref:fructosamine kinase family protein n=1 Tax=Marinicella meishanensis TaxID=2873263 RepID=UPI001CBECCC7